MTPGAKHERTPKRAPRRHVEPILPLSRLAAAIEERDWSEDNDDFDLVSGWRDSLDDAGSLSGDHFIEIEH